MFYLEKMTAFVNDRDIRSPFRIVSLTVILINLVFILTRRVLQGRARSRRRPLAVTLRSACGVG